VFIGAAGNRAVVRPLKSRRTLKLLQLIRDYEGKEGGARDGESWKKKS